MKRLLFGFSLIVTFINLFPQVIFSQNENFPVVIIKTPLADIEILEDTKPKENYTPQVPQFILKSREGSFIMAIGGRINPIIGWDLGNDLYDVSGIGFVTSSIPIPAAKGNKSVFFSDPLHSALDFHVVGLPGNDNQIAGYIKLQFNAPHKTVAINKVYLMYRGFTVGQANSLFQDGASNPVTIDPQGPNGEVSVTNYIIGYNSKSYGGFSFGISLEKPTFNQYYGIYQGKDYPDFDGQQLYANASQPVPDVPAYLQYQWSENNRVRLSGIVRNFRYVDLKVDKTKDVFGWGLQLSGNIQPFKPLILYYQGTYGQGIGNYINDLAGHPLSYIPKDDEPGEMKASPMLGWLFGASYKFTPKLVSNAMFSQARVWNSSNYYSDYKYGLYAAANVFYHITPYLKCGVEYIWGKHANFDHKSAVDNRLQTTIAFSL